MKKNNKGFFLAETLIVISLVTLILAFVYPNLSKLYETFKLKTNYYDQVQDIQALKTIDFVYNSNLNQQCYSVDVYGNIENKIDESKLEPVTVEYRGISNMNLKELYIADYDFKVDNNGTYANDYGLTRYLKRIRKNKLSPTSCRLIGIFEDEDGEYRYASVEHGIAQKEGEKYILKYTDNLTGIRAMFPEGEVEDGNVENIKSDEKLYMIIGDFRVKEMLTSLRNEDDYCIIDKNSGGEEVAASYSVDSTKTLPNSCSTYYFLPDGINYKVHLFSTINNSINTIDEQINAVSSLLNSYDQLIVKENINIMFVYGTNAIMDNSSNDSSFDIIKNKLIDTGILDDINYKISIIPPVDINMYNTCKSGSLIKDHINYNTLLNSKYSDKIFNFNFTPGYKGCESSTLAGFEYNDDSNIKLLELYIKELKGE